MVVCTHEADALEIYKVDIPLVCAIGFVDPWPLTFQVLTSSSLFTLLACASKLSSIEAINDQWNLPHQENSLPVLGTGCMHHVIVKPCHLFWLYCYCSLHWCCCEKFGDFRCGDRDPLWLTQWEASFWWPLVVCFKKLQRSFLSRRSFCQSKFWWKAGQLGEKIVLDCPFSSTLVPAWVAYPYCTQASICSDLDVWDEIIHGFWLQEKLPVVSHLLITEQDTRLSSALVRLLECSGEDIPEELLQMREQAVAVSKRGEQIKLCPYFKAFGQCRDQKWCSLRHTFVEFLDGPDAPYPNVRAPQEGEVKVSIISTIIYLAWWTNN